MPRLSRRTLLKTAGVAAVALALPACGNDRPPKLSASPATSAYPDTGLLADAAWLAARIDDPTLRLIDCSSIDDYRSGHIPGARHIWWQDTIEINNPVYGMLAGGEPRERIIREAGVRDDSSVVCYDASGGVYAARIIWMLHGMGFVRARLLDGGAAAWVAAGHTLTRRTTDIPPGELKPIPNEEVLSHAHDLSAWLTRPDVTVVDTRTGSERRETWYGRLRRGTIPGSRWLPRDQFLTPGSAPLLQPPGELRRRLLDSGIDLSTPEIIVFGLHGTLAALPWLAIAALGAPKVRVYDGAWAEWGADEQWPIESIE